ncbi:site-specific integrase [Weizmannia sp. CD-2023]|uniref:site-specific integrase n=1 Tax=Heyndrickxia TaxID=2837504 RepID=UPI002E1F92B0|nr:site-specific integrase [Weizmannia sp. CD-2023]MED4899723.1 site-specific integrase [Weizmannia sp. CD-2023]
MEYVQPIRDKKVIEEFKTLLNRGVFGERNRFLFVLGINTALRISDLLKLKVCDVRGKKYLKVSESKTGKTKNQLINNALKAEIEEYTKNKKDDEWLFPSRKGDKPLTRVQAYRIMNEVAQLMGVDDIGTHTLRKTFAYHFYQKTQDIYTLMELLNHSAPSVTRRYIGLVQDDMDKEIENFSL